MRYDNIKHRTEREREREREREKETMSKYFKGGSRPYNIGRVEKKFVPSIIPYKYNVYSNKEVPTFTARRKNLPR